MCHHEEGMATFILGALIGVVLGVLYAPAKGETTRRKLKRWTEEAYRESKEEITARAEELKEKVFEQAEELKEKMAEKADQIKHRALESSETLRGKAADGLEKAAETLDKTAKKIR